MLGSGTQADPYIIETLQDLQDMNLDLTAYYKLGNDIDAAETATWNDNGDGTYAGFEPIGNNSNDFQGSLDGQGHTISNLYINRPDTNCVGLIGYFYDRNTSPISTIENLTLKDVNIIGDYYTGALIGDIRCERYSTIDYTLIQNCTVDGGNISCPNGSPTGGLIGRTYRGHSGFQIWINNCHSRNLTITAKTSGYGAGLIGGITNGAKLNNCTSINNTVSGRYVGGLIGDLYSSGYLTEIQECIVDSNQLTGKNDSFVGGFICIIKSGTHTGEPCEIANCYVLNTTLLNDYLLSPGEEAGFIWNINNEDVTIRNCYTVFTPSGDAAVEGFAHTYSAGTIQDCYWDSEFSGVNTDGAPAGTTGLTTVQMKDPANFTSWDFTTIWANDGVANDGYHYLQSFPPPVSMPFRYWNGSEWVTVSEIRYWTGSEWIPVNSIKRWDGENWV